MSKPFANPFFEADMSKLFDMSKLTGDFKMPSFPIPNFSMPNFSPESMMATQRRNIEAYTALNQAIFESCQSFWRRQADMVRQSVEEAAQTANAIASSPTPEDKMIRQAEASKAALDKCLNNMRDIADTVAKCNTQALETVSTRMNESLDELRGIIKSGRAA